LEDLDDEMNTNSGLETTEEVIKYQLKSVLCSQLLNQIEQTEFHWLHDQSEISGENVNNIRREACKHFRNKYLEYL
jgi:hypothetical protein